VPPALTLGAPAPSCRGSRDRTDVARDECSSTGVTRANDSLRSRACEVIWTKPDALFIVVERSGETLILVRPCLSPGRCGPLQSPEVVTRSPIVSWRPILVRMKRWLICLVVALLPTLADGPSNAVEGPPGAWPLQPRPEVVRGFEPPSSPWGPGHRGVDLAGRPNQVVRAALAGRVSFVGRIAGVAVVVVDHGGRRTTYEPVRSSVHRGELVARGAALGHLELFGSHCLPRWCLHWGLIEGADHYLDPLSLLGVGRVRLLPLDPTLGPVRTAPAQARGCAWANALRSRSLVTCV